MKLHFHGAARSVTGSRHLLETGNGTVLLDCGLYQGPREEAFKRNRVFGFDLKAVSAVILSHAHIDHSGALPALVKSGWSGPIYATPATADLAALMLQDSASIQERDVQFVNKQQLLSDAETVILESTYGNRVHPPEEDEEKELGDIIRTVAGRKGKILVPAFAVGRTQHLTYRLKRLAGKIPEIPVYVDSPLAADVTEVYRRHPECHEPGTWTKGDPFGFSLLHTVRTAEESKRLNDLEGPAIIIAASGMCEHGRILHHLYHHGANERNAILFVGYQAEHTLGRRILENRKERVQEIRVHGRPMTLRAQVFKMNGLSAHADRPGLEAFIRAHARTLKNAFLVHGEPDAAEALAGWVRDTTMARTLVPGLGQEVTI